MATGSLLGLTLLFYGAKTLQRNYQWTDSRLLAESAIMVNPGNAKVYMTLGNHYAQEVCFYRIVFVHG